MLSTLQSSEDLLSRLLFRGQLSQQCLLFFAHAWKVLIGDTAFTQLTLLSIIYIMM